MVDGSPAGFGRQFGGSAPSPGEKAWPVLKLALFLPICMRREVSTLSRDLIKILVEKKKDSCKIRGPL